MIYVNYGLDEFHELLAVFTSGKTYPGSIVTDFNFSFEFIF